MVVLWRFPHSNRIWLISYPRSGNTWIRLFFERYTKISTRSITTPLRPLEIETEDTFLWKKHEIFHEKIDSSDKCIFLIRNPLNAIPSSIKWDGQKITDKRVRTYVQHYIAEIKEYSKHHGKKIIIYYEDLLKDFKKTIIPVILFCELHIDEKKIESFITQNEENLKKARNWYINEVPDKKPEMIYNDDKFNDRKKNLSKNQQNIIKYYIKDINLLKRYL